MRPGYRLRLGATVAPEFGPDASERRQRAVVVEGEPDQRPSSFGSGAYYAKPSGLPARAKRVSAVRTRCGILVTSGSRNLAGRHAIRLATGDRFVLKGYW
jgi:hypothetical protein